MFKKKSLELRVSLYALFYNLKFNFKNALYFCARLVHSHTNYTDRL